METEVELTKRYRQAEFTVIAMPYLEVMSGYIPKIKIITPNGETKWLSITEAEFAAIRKLLTA